MQLVERMIGSPPNCLYCGKGNTPDEVGNIGPFLDLQREVNWDDDCYLCEVCAVKIGAIFGMLSKDDVQGLHRRIAQLEGELHDRDAEIGLRKRREKNAVKRARALEEISS